MADSWWNFYYQESYEIQKFWTKCCTSDSNNESEILNPAQKLAKRQIKWPISDDSVCLPSRHTCTAEPTSSITNCLQSVCSCVFASAVEIGSAWGRTLGVNSSSCATDTDKGNGCTRTPLAAHSQTGGRHAPWSASACWPMQNRPPPLFFVLLLSQMLRLSFVPNLYSPWLVSPRSWLCKQSVDLIDQDVGNL